MADKKNLEKYGFSVKICLIYIHSVVEVKVVMNWLYKIAMDSRCELGVWARSFCEITRGCAFLSRMS